MRGIRKLGVAAVALAVGVLGAGKSHALIDDQYTSFTQPANALVMPFDEEEMCIRDRAGTGHQSTGRLRAAGWSRRDAAQRRA